MCISVGRQNFQELKWYKISKVDISFQLDHVVSSQFSYCRFQRVLTMVYNTKKYWVFGLCPLPGILKN
jgi:hypothetical protein